MPTTALSTFSATNRLDPLFKADDAFEINIALAAGTYQRGTVLGEITATPGTYKAYAPAAVDGSQTARVILRYGCTVDANGNLTLVGEWGQTQKFAPAFMQGYFRTQELVGLDAAAVGQLAGTLVEGTVTNGIIAI